MKVGHYTKHFIQTLAPNIYLTYRHIAQTNCADYQIVCNH